MAESKLYTIFIYIQNIIPDDLGVLKQYITNNNPNLPRDIGGLKYSLQQFKENETKQKTPKKHPNSLVSMHQLGHAGLDFVCTKRILN